MASAQSSARPSDYLCPHCGSALGITNAPKHRMLRWSNWKVRARRATCAGCGASYEGPPARTSVIQAWTSLFIGVPLMVLAGVFVSVALASAASTSGSDGLRRAGAVFLIFWALMILVAAFQSLVTIVRAHGLLNKWRPYRAVPGAPAAAAGGPYQAVPGAPAAAASGPASVSAAHTAPAGPSDDIPAQVKKLAELRDQGVLSDEEFGRKKSELLARM